jgi:hypothetical protein
VAIVIPGFKINSSSMTAATGDEPGAVFSDHRRDNPTHDSQAGMVRTCVVASLRLTAGE